MSWWLAVLAFLGAPFGVVVAWWLNLRSEERQREWALRDRERALAEAHHGWLLNRRADVYAVVLRSHGRAALAITDLHSTDPALANAKDVADRAIETRRTLMEAIADLQIVGSMKVYECADAVGRAIANSKVIDQGVMDPLWSELIEAIREDLRVM